MIEERLKKYCTHKHKYTHAGAHTSPLEEAVVGAPAQGYKETPLRLSRQTEVALGGERRLNRTDRRGRETSNNLQDENIKGKGKKDEREENDEQEATAPV